MATEFSAKMAGTWIVACSPYLKEKRIESPCRVIMSLLASEDEYAVHTQWQRGSLLLEITTASRKVTRKHKRPPCGSPSRGSRCEQTSKCSARLDACGTHARVRG